MPFTLEYLGDFSRVRVAASGLDPTPNWGRTAGVWPTWEALADANPTWGDLMERWRTATVTKTTDAGRTWQTVRGAGALDLDQEGRVDVDDFEFTPGTAHTYRVADALGRAHAEGTITPDLDAVWLKCPTHPYLNRAVDVLTFSPVARPARSALFEVIGRPEPIAVTAPRGAPAWDLRLAADDLRTDPDADPDVWAAWVTAALSLGEVMLLHVPAAWPVPAGYVHIGDAQTGFLAGHAASPGYVDLPCQAVAAPVPDIPAATITWAGTARAHASWADLAADADTWGEVPARWGSPADVAALL